MPEAVIQFHYLHILPLQVHFHMLLGSVMQLVLWVCFIAEVFGSTIHSSSSGYRFQSLVNLKLRGSIQEFPKYINKNYYVLPGSYFAPSL
jgi:hypothetical protein